MEPFTACDIVKTRSAALVETGEQRVLLAKMTTDRLVAAVVGLLLCLRGPAYACPGRVAPVPVAHVGASLADPCKDGHPLPGFYRALMRW